jgi:hypothetical protein
MNACSRCRSLSLIMRAMWSSPVNFSGEKGHSLPQYTNAMMD